MADVTEVFRDAARGYAMRSVRGMTSDRADGLCAEKRLPPPSARSPVLKSAYDTLALVRELRSFVARHRGDYLREGKDSDGVRDGIESEVRLSVKACQAHISLLRSTVEETARGRKEGPQGIAHLHGVVLILTEYLARVAASFDQCREVRFKKVLAEAEHKRRRAPPPPQTTKNAKNRTMGGNGASSTSSTAPNTADDPNDPSGGYYQQQQVLQQSSEGGVLVDELTGLVEQVRRAEGKVVEMSALSSLFASHVQSQAQQIEQLYTQAVESTRHLEGGNVELRKTISRRGDSQLIVAVILFVATFGILFLDWLSG